MMEERERKREKGEGGTRKVLSVRSSCCFREEKHFSFYTNTSPCVLSSMYCTPASTRLGIRKIHVYSKNVLRWRVSQLSIGRLLSHLICSLGHNCFNSRCQGCMAREQRGWANRYSCSLAFIIIIPPPLKTITTKRKEEEVWRYEKKQQLKYAGISCLACSVQEKLLQDFLIFHHSFWPRYRFSTLNRIDGSPPPRLPDQQTRLHERDMLYVMVSVYVILRDGYVTDTRTMVIRRDLLARQEMERKAGIPRSARAAAGVCGANTIDIYQRHVVPSAPLQKPSVWTVPGNGRVAGGGERLGGRGISTQIMAALHAKNPPAKVIAPLAFYTLTAKSSWRWRTNAAPVPHSGEGEHPTWRFMVTSLEGKKRRSGSNILLSLKVEIRKTFTQLFLKYYFI